MAKKDKETIFNEYLAELKAINPALEDVLKDEKVSAKLKEGVLARAEFSQSMDALKAERLTFEKDVSEARTKIEGWQRWYGDVSKEVATVQDQLQSYKEAYGELDTTDRRKVAHQAGLTVEEFQKRLDDEIRRRDVANLKFADDLTDIKMDYKERFKEKLPTEDIYKIAGEKGLSLTGAYDLFIKDRVVEADKKTWEDKIALARTEAVQEYASKHNLPVVSPQSDLVHVMDVKDAPNSPRDRVAAATAAFLKTGR